jgi:transcriptional regulator with XRE-family HTH domain
MSHKIDPLTLKHLREEKRMTLKKLADKSGIHISTLNRIETGKRVALRAGTVLKLCKALGVEEATLAAPAPPPKQDSDVDESGMFPKYQVNVRIDGLARNAMTMVSRRYNITPSQIIEVAPFLFFAAAEGSLRRRAEKLANVDRALDEVQAAIDDFPYLPAHAFVHDQEALRYERMSIDARDIFADEVDAAPIHWRSDDYNPDDKNPLVLFLREQVKSAGAKASFCDWSSGGSPDYRVCEAEVLEFVGGDKQAADGILRGIAILAQMPKELNAGGPEERAAWARQKVKERQDLFDAAWARHMVKEGQDLFDKEFDDLPSLEAEAAR